MQPTQSSRRILLPVKTWFIVLTLTIALFMNLVPLGRLPGVPDWVALVLAFWCIHQPLKVNMGAAFLYGLLMDVADASLMGQHALAYVLLRLVYIALYLLDWAWSRSVVWTLGIAVNVALLLVGP